MLNEILPRLQERIAEWADQLKRDKWITQKEMDQLLSFDTQSPSELFNEEERPLVVAFFGGTGVGKSSLLNRLARENIARTGIERPTSREVTLYLHQSVPMDNLPETFPTDDVKVALHRNESNRDVMWIDMPDFDSAEEANKEMVLQWLSYIDVLVYVVNPERYKDDRGWRLLLEFGARHAWMFVINHWDRGVEAQRDDFAGLLEQAGLTHPVIFRTDCNPDKTNAIDDDFSQLESSIQNLADENIIKHLEERGIDLRVKDLQIKTNDIISGIGSTASLEVLTADWQTLWSDTEKDIKLTQQWQIDRLSENFATTETRWISTAIQTIKGKEAKTPEPLSNSVINAQELWTEQVENLASDSLDKLTHRAKLRGITTGPIRSGLTRIRKEHFSIYSRNLQECLHEALQTPGSRWHRFFHKLVGYATTMLPVAAMFWVAYKVIMGFYLGSVREEGYLGFDFAIHSGLLIGLAWLVPYYLYRKTQPSRQQAAQVGMKKAIDKTLNELNARVLEFIEHIKKRQQRAVEGSNKLFSDNLLPSHYAGQNKDKILDRLLMKG